MDNLLDKIEQNEIQNIFIDIGAADGVDASNSFNLALNGYKGYMFEYNDSHFAKLATIYRDFPNVSLFKTKITPKNITKFDVKKSKVELRKKYTKLTAINCPKIPIHLKVM